MEDTIKLQEVFDSIDTAAFMLKEFEGDLAEKYKKPHNRVKVARIMGWMYECMNMFFEELERANYEELTNE